jgi:hypothetical protein
MTLMLKASAVRHPSGSINFGFGLQRCVTPFGVTIRLDA